MKPRADCLYAKLPENQRAQLYDWILTLGYPKTKERIALPEPEGFDIKSHLSCLHAFYLRSAAECNRAMHRRADVMPDPKLLWIPNGAADLDGDGDVDVIRADTWFENKDGKGLEWLARKNIPMGRAGPFGVCVRTSVLDLDRDGKVEVIIADAEIEDSKVVVLKNTDGKGGSWETTPGEFIELIRSAPPLRLMPP